MTCPSDVLRLLGRRERIRISRALLVKGLGFDHVVIADVANHVEINDLYVALTWARKTVTILGRVERITVKASPNGRD